MSHPISLSSSYSVAPNIALIKYWGKYESDLILPLNSSFSLTLDNSDLSSATKVTFSELIEKD